MANKNIRCWGYNRQGELGLGHTRPVSASELPSSTEELDFSDNVRQVFAGDGRSCALFENNRAKCWGDTYGGLLGYYSSSDYISNIAHTRFINFGAPIHHMALGGSHTCVALSTGEMRCFGGNFRGQLGLGHTRGIGGDQFISERNSSTFSDSRSTVVANFEYSVSSTNSQSVTFNSGLSFARNAIKSYQWDFGDDTTSISANPTHDFTSYGYFDVTLTVTDNFDQTATVLRRIRIQRDNVSPYFSGSQKLTLAQAKTHIIQLSPALDFDSSSLTYTIVQAPSQGTLSSCLGGTSDLNCSYQAPSNFTGEIEFSYKANDGTSDSLPAIVKLSIVDNPPSILKIASGQHHACALYENKKSKVLGVQWLWSIRLGTYSSDWRW